MTTPHPALSADHRAAMVQAIARARRAVHGVAHPHAAELLHLLDDGTRFASGQAPFLTLVAAASAAEALRPEDAPPGFAAHELAFEAAVHALAAGFSPDCAWLAIDEADRASRLGPPASC